MVATSYSEWMGDAIDYWRDSAQRSLLFLDILRQRGNAYLEHLKKGQPPVLAFDYEVILDGRDFDRPVNYSLVRIVDRRSEPESDRRHEAPSHDAPERRRFTTDQRHRTLIAKKSPEAVKRPIIIFDPRAGHGPGIGGSKEDSQIGMSLDAGHPVYFQIFSTYPVSGQTLADVRNAQIRFVEEVRNRHPRASRPAIIGNCQGGWAAALVAAERPDLVGPMGFNGSPLSYWGGMIGVNPMRYQGGLLGGVWITSLLSDLGNGLYDGAHIVGNFEFLNPANTIWIKQYHVYANVDTEAERYISFERWWGGFFQLSNREIHQIVDGLFIGNKLERGEFELEEGRYVDLKNNNNPVVMFASFGDNITSPQQAFNWIVKTYGTVEGIKRRGQVIVYISHSEIGHLGIFVSAKLARKEHKQIIASFDMLDYLPPGLYEMRIVEDPDEPEEYEVRYTEKSMEDIPGRINTAEDEDAFLAVRQISEIADVLYRTFISPWIRMAGSDLSAEVFRQLHPMRMQRYLFSDLNPWMIPINAMASVIKTENRRKPAAEDNPFRILEKNMSGLIASGLELYRDTRDAACELIFKTVYESPGMKILGEFSKISGQRTDISTPEPYRHLMNHRFKRGDDADFSDAVVRIFIVVMFADGVVSRRGFQVIRRIFARNSRMRSLSPEYLQQIVREQACIIQADKNQAIGELPRMLSRNKDRGDALSMIEQAVDKTQRTLEPQELAVLEQIQSILRD